jgi:hypothetical protein
MSDSPLACTNQEIGNMSRRAKIALVLLSVFNAIVLATNISLPTRAAGGMNYENLVADQDFTRAVQSIVQKCRVNEDMATIKC